MPIDFRTLYEDAKNAPMKQDPTSRKGVLDQLMMESAGPDPREQMANALDEPGGPPSMGSAGLQDALGGAGEDMGGAPEPFDPGMRMQTPFTNADAPNSQNPPGLPISSMEDMVSGPDVSNGQLVGARGLAGGTPPNPSPQAPPPMGGQPSNLPPSVPSPMAGTGGAPGASPSVAPPSNATMAPQNPGIEGNIGAPPPPMTPRAQMPSVTPPQAPGGMPGGVPGMQGANGKQPALDPQAVQQIGQASPQAMQQTMQLMQKTWEEQQMKNRMMMGRGPR